MGPNPLTRSRNLRDIIYKNLKKTMWFLIKLLHLHRVISPYYAGVGSILMLHRVTNQHEENRLSDNRGLEITCQHLEQLILYFKDQNYEFISLDQVPEWLTGKKEKRFIAFTLDDGYKDNYEWAYPLFKKHQVPFAIYVTTSFPNGEAIIWWNILEDIILKNSQVEFTYLEKRYSFSHSNLTEMNQSFEQIRQIMLDQDAKGRKELIEIICQKYHMDPHHYSRSAVLSWDLIKELSKDPLVTIGAHTLNHYALKQLTAEQSYFEIEESKKIIEEQIEKPVDHFSYPFGGRGEASEREFQFAQKIGFKTATTTRLGNIFSSHIKHLTALPRIHVDGNNPNLKDFELSLSGARLALGSRFKERVVTA